MYKHAYRLAIIYFCLIAKIDMGSENSSLDTQARAKKLAAEIGAYHLDVRIDTITAVCAYYKYACENVRVMRVLRVPLFVCKQRTRYCL